MAMLRVSSYRRLFEEERWGRAAGGAGAAGLRCGSQFRSSARGGASECPWPEPDFEAARALNREGVARFAKERTVIAALNDRLAVLIDVARCLEEENESLEMQIMELEARQGGEQVSSASVSGPADYSLEGVVERLRREKEQILCDTEDLRKELECLQARHEQAAEQRTLIQLERQDVALDVDAVTADCLALREQVCIYEEQLAAMQEQHETRVETLCGPADADPDADPRVSLEFPGIDIAPAIVDIKEYYSQLAECLQFESQAAAAITAGGEQAQGAVARLTGGKVTDVSKVTDVNALKELIAALQKELAELERCGEELEAEVEMKREAHLEEIAELEGCVAALEDEQAELECQMKEQCGDYDELLGEKMALDIEIAAYRGLVEDEDERLCYL